MTQDQQILDAAAAAAAVLRSQGYAWPLVQRLQSGIVALLADELQGSETFGGVCDLCDAAWPAGTACPKGHPLHTPFLPVRVDADLAAMAAHDQGDYCARCGNRACICGLHDGCT